ncbi:FecR domain-containing protein [Aquamicrobium lusatiense]|uniref:FecR family protein n=1 Tax=Aquamicrobium lusatiense TaxID=89772 RepID=UPI0024563C94|nr:FecR domain-containing protein [Aquamicrobium lusatiense]MDH4991982.1 FecR domain-containing protein [Aquamicrobium lusatiense]
MNDETDSRQLFLEAADLAIRLQNDPANPVSVETIRNWVARSPHHAAAWTRVAEIHGMTGKILAGQRTQSTDSKLSRRNLLMGGAAGLAAVAVGSWAVPLALLHARADHITTTAEIRRITLPDGSMATLGPDTAIATLYSDSQRMIELLAGMAFFEVAANPHRPFIVRSGQIAVKALGTAFDISRDAGFISVSVSHGTVEARDADAQPAQPARLSAGEWITIDASSHLMKRGTLDTGQVAAWREGLIVAEQETVSAMVAKIARWMPGSVVLADPSLGRREVSGVFDLTDPARALEAVVSPFGAKLRSAGSLMTVISPV